MRDIKPIEAQDKRESTMFHGGQNADESINASSLSQDDRWLPRLYDRLCCYFPGQERIFWKKQIPEKTQVIQAIHVSVSPYNGALSTPTQEDQAYGLPCAFGILCSPL